MIDIQKIKAGELVWIVNAGQVITATIVTIFDGNTRKDGRIETDQGLFYASQMFDHQPELVQAEDYLGTYSEWV